MADQKLRPWINWPLLRPRAPVVPVIRLSGVIGAMPLRGTGLTLNSVNPALERAFKVRGAKAVALAINSPGGSAVQSSLIAQRIRGLAGEAKIPVLAFIEDVGASGGYWLALAADELFAEANSIVGSIGVLHASFGFAEAIGRLGIERRLHTAGSKKAMLDPFRPQDPDDVARLRGILDDIHTGFKALVRERRGDRLKGPDEDLFEGQIWTGRAAVEAGLVDGIGNMHGVLRQRYGSKVRLPQVSMVRPWWQRRLGVGRSLDPQAFVEGLVDGLAERALWARYGL
jgi:serine protease SohB